MDTRNCYNCNQPRFTQELMANCPAWRATCNFCRKVGHYGRTCRGKRGYRRRPKVVGIQVNGEQNIDETGETEEILFDYRSLVG